MRDGLMETHLPNHCRAWAASIMIQPSRCHAQGNALALRGSAPSPDQYPTVEQFSGVCILTRDEAQPPSPSLVTAYLDSLPLITALDAVCSWMGQTLGLRLKTPCQDVEILSPRER